MLMMMCLWTIQAQSQLRFKQVFSPPLGCTVRLMANGETIRNQLHAQKFSTAPRSTLSSKLRSVLEPTLMTEDNLVFIATPTARTAIASNGFGSRHFQSLTMGLELLQTVRRSAEAQKRFHKFAELSS